MPVPPEEARVTSQSAVILTSHFHLNWTKLVEGIVESAPLPPCSNTELLNYSVEYNTPWKLKNKYYTAVVQLSVVSDQLPQQFDGIKEQAEALIVYWDNTQEDCLSKLNTILDHLDDFKPEVCLLVCDGFTGAAKLSRNESNQWCVAHGWELVELLPPDEDDADSDDLEDDFKESCGYHRIRGALHANCWTSMTYHQTAGKEGSKVAPAPTSGRHHLLPGRSDPFAGAPALPSCLLNSDDDEDDYDIPPSQELDESFDELFARFENLRVTAASLPREDRLDYAEKVAMAFLESMGERDELAEATGNEDGKDSTHENQYSGPGSVGDSSAATAEKTEKAKIEECSAEEDDQASDEIHFERLVDEDELEYVPTTVLTLEELGFPILENVEQFACKSDGELFVSSIDKATSSDGNSADVVENTTTTRDEFSAPNVDEGGITDEFFGPSYDAIEQEFVDDKNKKAAAVLKAKEEMLNEIEQFPDHNKKKRL